MEYAKKLDRRIRKTREAIYEAFRYLSGLKNVRRITMTEIAEEADIDRKTLYNHYKTVDDIRREQEAVMAGRISEALGDSDFDEILRNPVIMADALSGVFTDYAPYIKGLLAHEPNPQILDAAAGIIREKIEPVLSKMAPFGPDELRALSWHYSSWMVSAYRTWLETDLRVPFSSYYESLVGKLRTNYELLKRRCGDDCGPILLKFDLKD